VINASQGYTQIIGIEVQNISADANTAIAISSNSIVDKCIAKTGSNYQPPISPGSGTVRNCLIIDGDGLRVDDFNAAVIENCTVVGSGTAGIYKQNANGTAVVTNCVAVNSGTSDFVDGGGMSGSNCASGDTTASSVGVGTVTGVVITDGVDFVSPSTGDYNAVPGGKLDGAGADLSGTFTDDIAGNTRSAPWEIGAYEIAAAGDFADTNAFTITITSGVVTVDPDDLTSGQTLDNVALGVDVTLDSLSHDNLLSNVTRTGTYAWETSGWGTGELSGRWHGTATGTAGPGEEYTGSGSGTLTGGNTGFGTGVFLVPGQPEYGIYFGGTQISQIFMGGTEILRVYKGAVQLFGDKADGLGSGTLNGAMSGLALGTITGVILGTGSGTTSGAQSGSATGTYASPSVGQAQYTAAGSFVWTPPDPTITSVCVVAIGGGGGAHSQYPGGGGGLAWVNDIPVTFGSNYNVVVGDKGVDGNPVGTGGDSYFVNTSTCRGRGGVDATQFGPPGVGGSFNVTTAHGTSGGGVGGAGGEPGQSNQNGVRCGGGGGAGGYNGVGGVGGRGDGNESAAIGGDGSGGAAGGGGAGFGSNFATTHYYGGRGGGTALQGEGSSGAGGVGGSLSAGANGSNGGIGSEDVGPTTNRGGGQGGRFSTAVSAAAQTGGVRIIWGPGRSFPFNADDA
jgi:hypothetical protein